MRHFDIAVTEALGRKFVRTPCEDADNPCSGCAAAEDRTLCIALVPYNCGTIRKENAIIYKEMT